jgi:hypothetical protein
MPIGLQTGVDAANAPMLEVNASPGHITGPGNPDPSGT